MSCSKIINDQFSDDNMHLNEDIDFEMQFLMSLGAQFRGGSSGEF